MIRQHSKRTYLPNAKLNLPDDCTQRAGGRTAEIIANLLRLLTINDTARHHFGKPFLFPHPGIVEQESLPSAPDACDAPETQYEYEQS